jgi:hypothetical protein
VFQPVHIINGMICGTMIYICIRWGDILWITI